MDLAAKRICELQDSGIEGRWLAWSRSGGDTFFLGAPSSSKRDTIFVQTASCPMMSELDCSLPRQPLSVARGFCGTSAVFVGARRSE